MEKKINSKPVIDLFELLDEVEDMLSERRAIEGPAFDPFEGLDDQLDSFDLAAERQAGEITAPDMTEPRDPLKV